MKMRYALCALLAFAALTSACSKDDASDPAGSVTLNMYNEQNGSTRLGNSDVYINASNNFQTRNCSIAEVGRRSGLGAISFPELKLLSGEVAVQSGHGYLVFPRDAVHEFASGALAVNITADYYKVFVASPLKKEDQTVGAMVRYALSTPATYGLPAYDSPVEWLIRAENSDHLDIRLPSSDFEHQLSEDGRLFESEKRGSTLRIYFKDFASVNLSNQYDLLLRIRGSYTRVRLTFLM